MFDFTLLSSATYQRQCEQSKNEYTGYKKPGLLPPRIKKINEVSIVSPEVAPYPVEAGAVNEDDYFSLNPDMATMPRPTRNAGVPTRYQ